MTYHYTCISNTKDKKQQCGGELFKFILYLSIVVQSLLYAAVCKHRDCSAPGFPVLIFEFS